MSVYGLKELQLTQFGGLNTLLDPTNLPPFASPDCPDVQFLPELVKTRPGLSSLFTPITDLPIVTSLKVFEAPNGMKQLLAFTEGSVLYKAVTSTPSFLAGLSAAVNTHFDSATAFGAEYMGFSDGKVGSYPPFWYDGTNFEVVGPELRYLLRVAPQRPCLGNPWRTQVPIASIDRTSGTVTIDTGVNQSGIDTGDYIEVIGVTDTSFNGFALVTVSGSTISFAQAGPDATSSGGVVQLQPYPILLNDGSGNVEAGTHRFALIFEFRSGFRAISDVTLLFTATGGQTILADKIPTGPIGVTKRILCFTGVDGDNFYFIPASNMVIPDNTTTSVSGIDFTDLELLSGENVDDLFSLTELPYAAKSIFYANRMFWIGARNVLTGPTSNVTGIFPPIAEGGFGFQNLDFDGGFKEDGQGGRYPLGWFVVENGSNEETADVITGSALKTISTNGNNTPFLGQLFSQTEGGFTFDRNVNWRVRAWVRRSAGLVSGTLHICFSGAGGPGLHIPASFTTTGYQQFDAMLYAKTDTTLYSELVVTVTDSPTAGEYFLIEDIEFYPENNPVLYSSLVVSRADEPDAYDGVTGLITVAEDNGQAIRNAFIIRDFLYIVKEHSLYVTQDIAGSEPSDWTVREVSTQVGTPSLRGVGVGDEWVVIGDRDGLYYFDGGEPQKISQEIQPTWDAINWTYGHLIDVKVDTARKRIYVAVPYGASTSCDRILMLDYTEGFGDPLSQKGFGRKWSPWRIRSAALAMVEADDGTQDLYIGNNHLPFSTLFAGKILKLDDAALSDDGLAIDSYWQSGYFDGQGRILFGYLTANVVGAGVSSNFLFRGDQADMKRIRGWNLTAAGLSNRERQIQATRERVAVRIGTNLATHWFSLQMLSIYGQPSTWTPIRGGNQ